MEQLIYRTINLLYSAYVVGLGSKIDDIGLIITGILVFIIDLYLIYENVYDIEIMQPLRVLAFTLLGPYWIYKGFEYKDILLFIFGLTFMIFDGGLFCVDHKKI